MTQYPGGARIFKESGMKNLRMKGGFEARFGSSRRTPLANTAVCYWSVKTWRRAVSAPSGARPH